MGRITFPDGTVYEGGVVDGRPRGRARISFPDGSRYEGGLRKLRGGEFANGEPHGEGVMTYADGVVLEGLWHEGMPIGRRPGPEAPDPRTVH